MKKILKLMLITSGIMLIFLGVIGVMAYQSYNKKQKTEEAIHKEELDMRVYGMEKEDISEDTIIPLYLSGAQKNVETFTYKSGKSIYNTEKSKKAKEALEDLKKRNKYSIDNPLWALNPFGTNELSLYLYMSLAQKVTVKYTIHVEDEDIPDFNRTAKIEDSMLANKEAECQILGLIPGMENFIIIKLCDDTGKVVKRTVFRITPDKLKGSAQANLAATDGNSLEEMSNGLYFFLGHDSDNSKMPRKIYIYDNSGILRGAIPLINGRATNILFVDGQMLFNCSKNQFAQVNDLGQVVNTYKLSGYTTVNDFTYDGYGHIITIASKNKEASIEDRIVSLDLASGQTTQLLNMGSLLKNIKKKAVKPSGTKKLDWIGLNSVLWSGTDSVILSSRELSAIIKVINISSIKPTIHYVLGDEKLLKALGQKKRIFPKLSQESEGEESALAAGEFISQFGQSGLGYSQADENSATKYYLSMFNNNYGYVPTRKKLNWKDYPFVGTRKKKAATSFYYKYLVDEETGMYELAQSFQIPYSTYESSVQEYNGNIIVNSSSDCSLNEYDSKGMLIQELKYHVDTYTYRIVKMDLKNFWFN